MQLFRLTKDLSPDIFRAYDIRGVVNKNLTADGVYTIAKSIASEAVARGQNSIIVARDGRLTSPLFGQAVIAGILDSGVDVIDIGRVPTPVLYFATNILMSRSGIMITGSHNPANYNGLKVVLGGKTLADNDIKKLYERAMRGDFAKGAGELINVNVLPSYIARIKNDSRIDKKLKIVVDAGNGIAGKVAPNLFRALGAEVIELYCQVDGHFPNHHPDPTQIANLQDLIATVKQEHADIGLAFDGDGDRLGVVTNKGEVIWPDRQMMCFARELLQRSPNATILFDVKCSQHLPHIIKAHGGQPMMWKTGHSFIKNKMHEVNSLLAGEMSGHIFFKDRWYGFDDGMYAGARLLEILSQHASDADSLFNSLPNSVNTPELQIPVTEQDKFILMAKLTDIAQFPNAIISTIDGLRADFPYGFGLVRLSNTTPNLVLRFEADTTENLQAIQAQFRKQLLAIDATLKLPF